MSGSKLLGLGGEEDVGLTLEALANLVGCIADDDDDGLGPGTSSRVDDVTESSAGRRPREGPWPFQTSSVFPGRRPG